MEVSAEDQFKRLRHQIAEAQEHLFVQSAFLAQHPRDLHAQAVYAKAVTTHRDLRAQIDELYPPTMGK